MQSKLPNVGTTIFTVMSKLAAEVGALNLSQGFPSFAADPALIELVAQAMRDGHNQYAPMPGVASLREAIALKTNTLYGSHYHPDHEVTITSGATEALFAAITAVVQPGDEVLVFEPAYDSYVPAIELAGGHPIYVSLAPPDYGIDWDQVRLLVTPRTRLVVVNTPHNPTGRVWTGEDMHELAALAEAHNLLVVADEVYEHIRFDGRTHHSLASYPVLRERTFVIGSFGKTFHITGWKIGYCLAPPALTVEFRKVHQFLTFSVSTPMQHALATYLTQPDRYTTLPNFYQQKRDLFLSALAGSRFTFLPTEGTFFQNVSYAGLTDEPDHELAVRLTRDIGVASIPVSVFYQQRTDYHILRFCFAKDDTMLLEAGQRLNDWSLRV
ncbi:aminotransferase class I and II [Fibrella aestuarina BUZ 2]|uniref:Aminotransferase class I and II n=1 Tax=Fibrella aestuarina BUZ 2 TaxID=1166018 RepID=I0KAC3_9BACT|nr:methionine aminotransferase [Fibrella aestuarina]CCH01076.1 aminotransferase class I and II [Fibrella aestuarina BUZ 2]